MLLADVWWQAPSGDTLCAHDVELPDSPSHATPSNALSNHQPAATGAHAEGSTAMQRQLDAVQHESAALAAEHEATQERVCELDALLKDSEVCAAPAVCRRRRAVELHI